MMNLRTKDFKTLEWHGESLGKDDKKEAKLRNDSYQVRKISLVRRGKVAEKQIKLIAYEMPLDPPSQKGGYRRNCIDLLGINNSQRPYIFELKKTNGDDLPKTIQQINKYQNKFEKIREYIEKEITEKINEETVFLGFELKKEKKFKFNGRSSKIILAPKEYYNRQRKKGKYIKPNEDIEYCYFSCKEGNISKQPVLKLHFKWCSKSEQ